MRILCLQLKRIGDAILTAPALASLREAFPHARVTLVVHGAAGQLAPAFTAVDDCLVYAPGRPNVPVWGRVVSGRWSACYDFTGTDRSALMARMSRAGRVFGYRRFVLKRAWRAHGFTDLVDASVRDLHTVDFFRALTGLPAARQAGFRIPDAPTTIDNVDLEPDRFLVVHPGSAREEKCWPAARWSEVIRRLALPVVLTGGPDRWEQEHVAGILRGLPASAHVRNLAGRLSLLELGRLISRARLVLSVDSAAMHLAAMAGRPQIALFGPTNPFHWRPRHPGARVLLAGDESGEFTPRHRAAAMSELSTDRVLEAISEALPVRDA